MKNIKLVIYPAVAALSLVAAFAARAEGPIGPEVAVKVITAKTRAQVQAEVLQARAAGELTNGSAGYDPLAFVNEAAPQPRTTLFAHLMKKAAR